MENVLITGVNGSISASLTPRLVSSKKYNIYGLDINDANPFIINQLKNFIKASVLQKPILIDTISNNKISSIFHLAGIQPMESENFPEKTQVINSGGFATVIDAAKEVASSEKRLIKVIFPSSISVYGLPNVEIRANSEKLKEGIYLNPTTIYGITKLYCEMLGTFYSENYPDQIDFRSIRIPGIIGTIRPDGNNAEALNLVHSIASGNGLESYVSESTRLPFIALPDVAKALTALNEADKKILKNHVYNIGSFSITVGELAKNINSLFPDSSVSFAPDPQRQKIVDSWPSDIDDSEARKDWSWQPDFDIKSTFEKYLIPEMQNLYGK